MLTVHCPQCSHQMMAPDEFAGKNAKCSRCGHKFVIPFEDADFVILDEPIAPAPTHQLPLDSAPHQNALAQSTEPEFATQDEFADVESETNAPPKSGINGWFAAIAIISAILLLGILPGILLFPTAGALALVVVIVLIAIGTSSKQPVAEKAPASLAPEAPIASLTPEGPMRAQTPPLPNDKLWYYAHDGRRCGPVNGPRLVSLIQSETISLETSVWTEGMAGWAPARRTGLAMYLPNAGVPPLNPDDVQNGFAWALAFAPIGYALVEAPFTRDQFPWLAGFAVGFTFNTFLCWADRLRLRNAGHSAPAAGWVFLVPVYLFVRASKIRQTPSYGYVWILCFLISCLMGAAR